VASGDLDREVQDAQGALLARFAPETQVRQIRWSGGETQALELGAGEPLLLVHGGGDGAYEWVPFMPLLARHHRVLAIDRPGHGLATPFDYDGVDLAQHANTFLGDVLDGLGLRSSALLSNSVGGWWSAVFALEQPERVRRVVIAGHPPGVTRDVPLPLRILGTPVIGKPVGRLVLGRPSREGNRKFWGQVLVAHPEDLPDELLDYDVAHTRRNRHSALSLVRRMVGPGGVRKELLLGERWSALRAPLLFIHGDRDAFVTADVASAWATIASGGQNVVVAIIADAGHLPWLDAPEAVLEQIERFLA
jgi:pimeloyl-ACP methyl ester carboxylesterase